MGFLSGLFWLVTIILCVVVGAWMMVAQDLNDASHQEIKIITVSEKIPAHGDNGKYLVIDTNETVYQISDSIFICKFDASDRYASLHAGSTYNITVGGYRNHFWSWYQNIIEIRGA